METIVCIQNFSSILEIIFAINFVFIFFELRPVFNKEWNSLYREIYVFYDETSSVIKNFSYKTSFFAFSLLRAMGFFINTISILLSIAASGMSIYLLYQAGIDPDYSLNKSIFMIFFFALFA